MTWQAILGAVFVLVGVLVRVLTAAGLLGSSGDIVDVSDITNLGMLLIGKELVPGSADSLAARSRAKVSSIPPVAIVLLMLCALPACAPVQLPQSQDAIDAKRALDDVADKLDARLSVARGLYDMARAGVDWVCGAEVVSEQCSKARVIADGVNGYLHAADDAIDLYRETGQRFDDAMKVLKEAEESVGKLRTLANDLKRGLT